MAGSPGKGWTGVKAGETMTDPYKYEANHTNFDMNDPVQVYRPEVYGEWVKNSRRAQAHAKAIVEVLAASKALLSGDRKRALIAHIEAVNKLLEFEWDAEWQRREKPPKLVVHYSGELSVIRCGLHEKGRSACLNGRDRDRIEARGAHSGKIANVTCVRCKRLLDIAASLDAL